MTDITERLDQAAERGFEEWRASPTKESSWSFVRRAILAELDAMDEARIEQIVRNVDRGAFVTVGGAVKAVLSALSKLKD